MARANRSERDELIHLLTRLVHDLEGLRSHAQCGATDPAPYWIDGEFLYAEADARSLPDDHLDLSVHGGRLFLTAVR